MSQIQGVGNQFCRNTWSIMTTTYSAPVANLLPYATSFSRIVIPIEEMTRRLSVLSYTNSSCRIGTYSIVLTMTSKRKGRKFFRIFMHSGTSLQKPLPIQMLVKSSAFLHALDECVESARDHLIDKLVCYYSNDEIQKVKSRDSNLL